jgi:RecA-family ATPase
VVKEMEEQPMYFGSSFSPQMPPLGGGEREREDGQEPDPQKSFTVKTPKGLLKLETLKDVVSSVPEEREWLVDGIIPASGLGIISGPPKIRKSTLAIHLARSVAAGTPFLNLATQKWPAIYINYEMPRDYLVELTKAGEVVDNVFFLERPEPRLATETIGCVIQATKDELRFDHGLLIIDSFRGAFKLQGDKENSSGDAGAILRQVQEIAVRSNWVIFIIHHDKKYVESRGGITNLAGSGDFGAAADVIWMLAEPKNIPDTRELEIVGRIPPIDKLTVKLSPAECINLESSAQEFKWREQEKRIQEVVGTKMLTEAEIGALTKIHATTLKKRLEFLQKQGQMNFKPLPGKGQPKGWFNVVGSPANETTDEKTLNLLEGIPTETLN